MAMRQTHISNFADCAWNLLTVRVDLELPVRRGPEDACAFTAVSSIHMTAQTCLPAEQETQADSAHRACCGRGN